VSAVWASPALPTGRAAHVKITRPGTSVEFIGRIRVDYDGELVAIDLRPDDEVMLGIFPGDDRYVVEALPEPLPTAAGVYLDVLGGLWRIRADGGPLIHAETPSDENAPAASAHLAPFTLLVPKDNPA
jgi:hypothetical protein